MCETGKETSAEGVESHVEGGEEDWVWESESRLGVEDILVVDDDGTRESDPESDDDGGVNLLFVLRLAMATWQNAR